MTASGAFCGGSEAQHVVQKSNGYFLVQKPMRRNSIKCLKTFLELRLLYLCINSSIFNKYFCLAKEPSTFHFARCYKNARSTEALQSEGAFMIILPFFLHNIRHKTSHRDFCIKSKNQTIQRSTWVAHILDRY